MSPKSPSRSPPPDSSANRIHPQPRHTRTDFNLEHNPFEQSFRSSSNVRNSSPTHDSTDDPNQKPTSDHERPKSRSSDDLNSHRSQSPRPVLPPLASISSPADQSYPWGYNPSSVNSLRSGPLSPAMLTGPQQQSDQSHLPFDPATFRTGLTPRSGLTPRTGLTPGTGLTPLVGGSVPFPASPNTATLMALMANPAGTNTGPTITPNTLSAITGALNSTQSAPNSYPHQQDSNNPAYLASASNAASTAANGLFLLSQAHQELTKREEAQARAGGNTPANIVNGSAVQQNGKRGNGVKRKSYDNASPPPPTPSLSQAIPSKAAKRTRSAAAPRRKGSERGISEGIEDDDDNDDMDDMDAEEMDISHPPPSRKGAKKPETEEEKRRNFLERNRQAALKCRQRKKAWLAQLQAKVEYLSNENERLTSALVSSREEISRLSALVGGAGVVGPVPMGVSVNGVGVNGVSVSGPGVQPVSMNVSLSGKSGGPPVASVGSAAGGRSGSSGYGY